MSRWESLTFSPCEGRFLSGPCSELSVGLSTPDFWVNGEDLGWTSRLFWLQEASHAWSRTDVSPCVPSMFANRPSDAFVSVPSHTTGGSAPLWCSSCTTSPSSLTPKQVLRYSYTPTLFASGDDAGLTATFLWRTKQDGGVSPGFLPRDEARVKALACAAVSQTQLPLRRLSRADLATQASAALGQPISRTAIGRILEADARKPWRYEYWLFPRDPQFAEKAGRVLDLYAGLWQGQPLSPHDHIISADEKTSMQARRRCPPSLSPAAGRKRRVEHE
jgi:hypothetical protein